MNDDLAAAYRALDACDTTLTRLDKMCCEPGRSPRMAELAGTLAEARSSLDAFEGDVASIRAVVEVLEEAGSQIGWLQIGCCTEARMPLYADVLSGLTSVQISIHRAVGQGH